MKTTACTALLTIAMVLGTGAAAADCHDPALAATLRQLVERHYAAYGARNVDETMRYIDSKAPGYDKTKKALPRQFELGAKSQLIDFRYIGHDDEFAVARVKFRTSGRSGTSVVENTVDTMTVFHQENGQWKFWDQLILGVEAPGAGAR